MTTKGKIVDAFAEWDDRGGAFRVYLVREATAHGETFDDLDNATPMEAVHGIDPRDDETEARLYRAAFVACPKDIGNMPVRDRVLGWPKEAPARRVASAVKKEIAAIAKGKPGPTDEAIRLVLAMTPRGRK